MTSPLSQIQLLPTFKGKHEGPFFFVVEGPEGRSETLAWGIGRTERVLVQVRKRGGK